MNAPKLVLTAAVALTASASAVAEPPSGKSLSQSRLEIVKGTTPGIVIFGDKPSPQRPDLAASAASADVTSTGTPPKNSDVQATAGPTPSLSDRLRLLFAPGRSPSGQSLDSAKRLESAEQGIALPSAGKASGAKGSAGGN